jgi:hypothetical protein
MSLDPAFMLGAALQVLRLYRDEATRRGLREEHDAGVEGWKTFYVGKWAEAARKRGLGAPSLQQAARLARLAPLHLSRKIASLLLRRGNGR